MFDDIIRKYSAVYGVPETWIRAIIQTESSFDPNAFRAEPRINDASRGLMQLLLRTAQGLGFTGPAADLFDPDVNVNFGTKLLAQLRASYGDDAQRVYSAYNSGKPDLYLTNSQVTANVGRFVRNLESFIQSEPLVAASGSFGVVLGALLLWYWVKKPKPTK